MEAEWKAFGWEIFRKQKIMHQQAYDFVARFKTDKPIRVIEIGSRNINGTVRPLFPNAKWIGLDLYEGPDVDVVISALDYKPEHLVDLVICCEVLEHARDWKSIIEHSATWLKIGGEMLVTCAGPGRAEHSAIDGNELKEDEHYENLTPEVVSLSMRESGLWMVSAITEGKDTQAIGCLPGHGHS